MKRRKLITPMKASVKVSLSVLVVGVCTEAIKGALWCLNAPSDGLFALGAVSVPIIAGAMVLWLTRIWRHTA